MGLGTRKLSSRLHRNRNAERFVTNALTCKIGTVRDVSETGFRISSRKRITMTKGQVHEIQVRTEGKQISIKARVQWVRRVCWIPAAYEAGFQIIDPRPGVGSALRQFGQFGFASGNTPTFGEAPAGAPAQPAQQAKTKRPRPQAFLDLENVYLVLEINRDASLDEIKSAYRKLAQKHHPDHDDSPDAVDRFDRIAKAYSILSDSQRRKWYDQMLDGEAAA